MKLLIIRFSSIGDLTQSLSIPSFIKAHVPNSEIHFVTRKDLAEIVEDHPKIDRLWTLDKNLGFKGLLKLIFELRKEKFTHIYDAHNNLRSFLIRYLVPAEFKLVRPMMRLKRFLLLNFHINRFEMPFSGQRDLIKPLEKWGFTFSLPPTPQLFMRDVQLEINLPQSYVAAIPSAAYELKRWPIKHWSELFRLNSDINFVILAGPSDHFTEAFNVHRNVLNLTGKTTLKESAKVIAGADACVSNDTGLLHFSEQLGKPTIALMGPAPFGFPSRPSTRILEKELKCRPCSKHGQGPCTNSLYQQCLDSIDPKEVHLNLIKLLGGLKK